MCVFLVLGQLLGMEDNWHTDNKFTILKVSQTLQQHENFTLHSVSTLIKITSSVAHVRRFCFVQRRGVQSTYRKTENLLLVVWWILYQKNVNILRRKGVWRVANNPNVLAETRLGIMVHCLCYDNGCIIINIWVITRNLFNEWNLMNGKINIFRSHDTDLCIMDRLSVNANFVFWINKLFFKTRFITWPCRNERYGNETAEKKDGRCTKLVHDILAITRRSAQKRWKIKKRRWKIKKRRWKIKKRRWKIKKRRWRIKKSRRYGTISYADYNSDCKQFIIKCVKQWTQFKQWSKNKAPNPCSPQSTGCWCNLQ